MNKIVKRHLPVSELPKDWRVELPNEARVRVEIELENETSGHVRLAQLVGTGRNIHGTEEEAIEHIARLRED